MKPCDIIPGLRGFVGIDIIVSEYLPKTRRVQFRFPRSKKSRIRKKWRKEGRNWAEVDATRDVYFIAPGKVLVSPEGATVLRAKFEAAR